MNWRRLPVHALLKMSGSEIPQALSEISACGNWHPERLAALQQGKLEQMLRAAYANCPYYTKVLGESGVLASDGTIDMGRWSDVPILTRSMLRDQFVLLQSKLQRKGAQFNTSGGSSGEPVRFAQDAHYRDWNLANKIYYKSFCGQQIGEPELRIWGSERDVLQQGQTVQGRLQNWLYNRREVNAFHSNEEHWLQWVDAWRRFQPSWVEAYVQPLYEFARYLKMQNLRLPGPKGIVTSAGTLYPMMKALLQEVFDCPVLNRYGSREVGDMACSCPQGDGLHLSIWNHYLEIIDDQGRVAPPGVQGKIVVTTLNNLVQPLIRYEIGDIGVLAEPGERCSCGRSTPLLKGVEGRETSVFRTLDGGVVPAEFFIHFIGVVFNDGFIRRFQVIQKALDHVLIKVVVADEKRFDFRRAEIESAMRRVMGQSCRIEWQRVDDIPPLQSGKFLYTISEVS